MGLLEKLQRRGIASRPVGPTPVVFLMPGFDRRLGLCHIQKPVPIQTLLSEAAIECFDKRIIGWLARSGEIQLDSLTVGPEVQIPGHKLRTVIDSNTFRETILLPCLLQGLDDSTPALPRSAPNGRTDLTVRLDHG